MGGRTWFYVSRSRYIQQYINVIFIWTKVFCFDCYFLNFWLSTSCTSNTSISSILCIGIISWWSDRLLSPLCDCILFSTSICSLADSSWNTMYYKLFTFPNCLGLDHREEKFRGRISNFLHNTLCHRVTFIFQLFFCAFSWAILVERLRDTIFLLSKKIASCNHSNNMAQIWSCTVAI